MQQQEVAIKSVVFDFDGVLVDSNAVKRGAYFDIFAPLGNTAPIIETVLKKNRDGDRYQIIDCILHRLYSVGFVKACGNFDKLIEDYVRQYNGICEEHAAGCAEIQGASDILPRLAEKYSLYINSATPEEPLRRVVARRGWGNYFRRVFGRPTTKVENLMTILQSERIDGARLIFIGDDQRDMETAVKCGCRFVGIITGTSRFDSQPKLKARDLFEVEKIIIRISRESSF